VTYEARDGANLVGSTTLIGYPSGWVVTSTWVPLRESCPTDEGVFGR
jgi:hypothetical protein